MTLKRSLTAAMAAWLLLFTVSLPGEALSGPARLVLLGKAKVNTANILAQQIAAFPGIVAFWSADRGVNQSAGTVSSVSDQSANGYTLTPNISTTSWSASGLYRGPSFNFSGTSNLSATGIAMASRSFSVFAFFQAPTSQNTAFGRIMGMVASGQTADNAGPSMNIFTNNPSQFQYNLFDGPNTTGGFFNVFTPSIPTLLGWTSAGAGQGVNTFANGGSVNPAGVNNGLIGTTPNTVYVGGGLVTGTYFNWTGNLGFLLITTQALTAGQIATLTQFADAVWGTGLAGNNGTFPSLAFSDNFASASTVDANNTLAPGFNWYLNNFFPVPNGNILSFFNLLTTPTPSTNAVVSGNTLTLSNTSGAPSYGTLISTCGWNGSQIVGHSFANGFYVDVAISFDPTLGGSSTSIFWPAIWMVPTQLLNNTIGSSHWVEPDLFEAFPNASGDSVLSGKANAIMTMHDEAGSSVNNQSEIDFAFELPAGFSFTTSHHFQMMWKPASRFGGVGFWANYLDGVQKRVQYYSSSTVPNPALSPTNSSGALSVGDSHSYCLFIDPGTYGPPSQPVTIYSAAVYQ